MVGITCLTMNRSELFTNDNALYDELSERNINVRSTDLLHDFTKTEDLYIFEEKGFLNLKEGEVKLLTGEDLLELRPHWCSKVLPRMFQILSNQDESALMVYLIEDGIWYGVDYVDGEYEFDRTDAIPTQLTPRDVLYVEGTFTWKNRNIVKRMTECAFIALCLEEKLKDKGVKINLGQPIHMYELIRSLTDTMLNMCDSQDV